jgi:hypothetical protein
LSEIPETEIKFPDGSKENIWSRVTIPSELDDEVDDVGLLLDAATLEQSSTVQEAYQPTKNGADGRHSF